MLFVGLMLSSEPTRKKSAEETLAKIAKDQIDKQSALAKKYNEELQAKRKEITGKQKGLVQLELDRRIRAGEGAISANMGAIKTVTIQLQQELSAEQQKLAAKYGAGQGGLAGQASFLADSLLGGEGMDGAEADSMDGHR